MGWGWGVDWEQHRKPDELREQGHGRHVKVSAESNAPFTAGVAWERAGETS